MVKSFPEYAVYRDPRVGLWQVVYNGRFTTPTFTSKGAASAYLSMLLNEKRKPEYPKDKK